MTDRDAKERNSDMPMSSATPPITGALRAEARANPGSWVYAIDRGFEGSLEVPPQGIVGAWHSNENGELSDEFMPNPNYVPTPQARGWAEPTTALERVLQLAQSGYAPHWQLAREFASSAVFTYSRAEGGIFLAPAQDGSRLVYAFTDADKATASGYSEYTSVRGDQLALSMPEGVRIALNPGLEPSAIISPDEIAGA
jgi:hypothetical protein